MSLVHAIYVHHAVWVCICEMLSCQWPFLYRQIIIIVCCVCVPSAMIRLFGSSLFFFVFLVHCACTQDYVYLCFLVQFDDDNSIWLYCHVVINDIINVTPTHKIFKMRLNVFRWWSQPDDDDVMAEAEYSPENEWKEKNRWWICIHSFIRIGQPAVDRVRRHLCFQIEGIEVANDSLWMKIWIKWIFGYSNKKVPFNDHNSIVCFYAFCSMLIIYCCLYRWWHTIIKWTINDNNN